MLTGVSKECSASEIELNCLLCRKGFQHCEIVSSVVPADFSSDNKNTVEYIKKAFHTFDKHLNVVIKGDSFLWKKRKKDTMTPFCKTCLDSAEKLMQFDKQLEEIQRNLEEFIHLLSLEILTAKGLGTFAFQNLIRKQNIQKGKDNTNNIINESKNETEPSHSESDVEPFIDTIKPEPVDHNDHYDYDDEYEGDSFPNTNPPLAHSDDDDRSEITNNEDTPVKVELVEDAGTIEIIKNSAIPRSRYLPQRKSATAALQLIRNNNESKLGSSDSESVNNDEKFTRRKHGIDSDETPDREENNVEADDYQASFDENEEMVSDNSFEENEEKYEVENSSEKQPGHRKTYPFGKEEVRKDHIAAENTSFTCGWCGKVFKSGLSLNNHIRIHKNKEEFKKEQKIGFECQVCQESFKLSKDLSDHSEKTSHKNEKNFSCSECPSSYFRRIDLKYHKRIHDPVRTERYRCKLCQKSFRKSTALKAHHQRRHAHIEGNEIIDKNLFACEMCPKAFETNQGLLQHKKASHNDKKNIHECESCGLRFRSQVALSTHEYIHTGEKPFKCEIENCTSSFTSKAKLKRHFIKNHTNDEPFVCNQPDCDKAFKIKILLDQHILMHIDPVAAKRFVCEMCGKGFAKSEHLRRHRKLHDVHTRFNCEEPNCGKSYNSKMSLKEHLKKGHDVKADDKVKTELLCSICGLKCKTPYVLKRHTQTHTGEKLFQCEECGKSFATRGNLTIHKNIAHLGKRYDCEFCAKHFNSKAAVKEHQIIHLRTQLTFLCTICKQDFPDKKALAAHQRTHSDQEKRYKCEKCLTGFTGGTNYKIHISKCKKSIQS